MAMVATIAAKAFGLVRDQGGQLVFARDLFGEASVLEHLTAWMRRERKHAHLLAEQHALMLERILIEHAKPGLISTPLTAPEPALVARVLLGCTSLAYAAGEEMSQEARVPEDLLAIFLQNGAYNSKAMPMGEMARVQELFVRIAQAPELLPTQDKICPIDEWRPAIEHPRHRGLRGALRDRRSRTQPDRCVGPQGPAGLPTSGARHLAPA